MGKNIVLLADGTGNSAAKAFKTNVWRLYEALNLAGQEQIATFSDGVGTSSYRFVEVIGLALGFGVKKRVINLYKFLCLNYQPGDNIYVFGFSRGAFIARLLVGVLAREGIVEFQSHEELDRNAAAAYRAFREKAFRTRLPWTRLVRKLRNAIIRQWNRLAGSRQYEDVRPTSGPGSADEITVAFLGVWDTVSAYGLPIDELTLAVNRWVWPLTFERTHLLSCVRRARQALSLDDERRTFFPISWNPLPDVEVRADPHRLQQVWFAGVHSNVGGGYPDDRLSYVPLLWMLQEASRAGLIFEESIVTQYRALSSEDGRIYDSRANLGFFYRYHPRDAKRLMGNVTPLVDSSVVMRMADGPDGYAPVSLTEDFHVLMPSGSVQSFLSGDEQISSADGSDDVIAAQDRVKNALTTLRERRKATETLRGQPLQIVLDTIWWRRGVYYLLLLFVVVAAAYPLFFEYVSLDALTDIQNGARPIVGSLVGVLELVLPGFAKPWLNASARSPALAACLIASIGGLMWLSAFLRIRIADRARIVWGSGRWQRDLTLLRAERAESRKRLAAAGTFVTAAATIVALGAGNQRAAGVFAAALALIATFWGMQWKGKRGSGSSLLQFARFMRTNKTTVAIYMALKNTIFPMTSLIAVAILFVALGNKVLFEVASASGMFCTVDDPPNETTEIIGDVNGNFDLTSMCWSTGKVLMKGERYKISIVIPSDNPWLDKGETPSGAAGFKWTSGRAWYQSQSIAYAATIPLRRWWGFPYFHPIARIGLHGADEQPLAPIRMLSRERSGKREVASITEASFLLTPKETGRLYLYVNDVVLGIPGLYDIFYRDNSGGATVRVENVSGY